jgi:hypothetical protein
MTTFGTGTFGMATFGATVDSPTAGRLGVLVWHEMRVYATIDGRPVQLTDWQADSTVNWGHRSLTGKVPESVTWAEQESPVTLWLDDGTELWAGKLTQDSWGTDGLRNVRAEGYAAQLSAQTARMFYRIDGTSTYVDMGDDPHGMADNAGYDVNMGPGAIRWRFGDGTTAFASADVAGAVLWVEGAQITQYKVTVWRSFGHTQFDIRTISSVGPSTTGQVTVADHPLSATDGTSYTQAVTTADHDQLRFILRCNAAITPTVRRSARINEMKVYGRTTDDAFSASEVVADVGANAGFDTAGVQSNGLPILPLDWTEDHTALLSYMAELADWHWEALGTSNGTPHLAFGPYETTWTGYQGYGIRPDWEPQRRYNRVRVPFRYVSGVTGEVSASPAVDPLPGKEVVFYADELTDPQQTSALPAAVAAAQAEYRASSRVAGRIQLGIMNDATGAPRSGYKVKPGHIIDVADRPDLGPQRVAAMTYRDKEDVVAEINDDFSIVRLLSDLRSDRPEERRKKKKRRKK